MADEKDPEEWRAVDDAPGYWVSDLGRVRGPKGHILACYVSGHGYVNATPLVGKKTRTMGVHRLVAKAFIPNPDQLPIVNHIDSVRSNNVVSNLEWVTHKTNAEKAKRPAHCARRSRKVVERLQDGTTKDWPSIKAAAAAAGVATSRVSRACKSEAPEERWTFAESVRVAPEGEEWRPINGYMVSSHGVIKTPEGQITCGRARGKYLGFRNTPVHRLVATAFCAKPPNADVVNHKDGNPRNNRADNLEWVTQQENCQHAQATGLSRHFPVRQIGPGVAMDYRSVSDAARATSVSASDIVACCKGKKRRAGGCIWKYLPRESWGGTSEAGIDVADASVPGLCELMDGLGLDPPVGADVFDLIGR